MIDLKFVGMVTEDETVDAAVDLDDEAVVTVTNHDSGAVVVVGSMRRTG